MPAKKSSTQKTKRSSIKKSSIQGRTKSEQKLEGADPNYDKVFGRAGTVFQGAWLQLAEACGGVEKLVEFTGIPYATIYRWAVRGGAVPMAGRMAIVSLANAYNVPVPPMKIPTKGR